MQTSFWNEVPWLERSGVTLSVQNLKGLRRSEMGATAPPAAVAPRGGMCDLKASQLFWRVHGQSIDFTIASSPELSDSKSSSLRLSSTSQLIPDATCAFPYMNASNHDSNTITRSCLCVLFVCTTDWEVLRLAVGVEEFAHGWKATLCEESVVQMTLDASYKFPQCVRLCALNDANVFFAPNRHQSAVISFGPSPSIRPMSRPRFLSQIIMSLAQRRGAHEDVVIGGVNIAPNLCVTVHANGGLVFWNTATSQMVREAQLQLVNLPAAPEHSEATVNMCVINSDNTSFDLVLLWATSIIGLRASFADLEVTCTFSISTPLSGSVASRYPTSMCITGDVIAVAIAPDIFTLRMSQITSSLEQQQHLQAQLQQTQQQQQQQPQQQIVTVPMPCSALWSPMFLSSSSRMFEPIAMETAMGLLASNELGWRYNMRVLCESLRDLLVDIAHSQITCAAHIPDLLRQIASRTPNTQATADDDDTALKNLVCVYARECEVRQSFEESLLAVNSLTCKDQHVFVVIRRGVVGLAMPTTPSTAMDLISSLGLHQLHSVALSECRRLLPHQMDESEPLSLLFSAIGCRDADIMAIQELLQDYIQDLRRKMDLCCVPEVVATVLVGAWLVRGWVGTCELKALDSRIFELGPSEACEPIARQLHTWSDTRHINTRVHAVWLGLFRQHVMTGTNLGTMFDKFKKWLVSCRGEGLLSFILGEPCVAIARQAARCTFNTARDGFIALQLAFCLQPDARSVIALAQADTFVRRCGAVLSLANATMPETSVTITQTRNQVPCVIGALRVHEAITKRINARQIGLFDLVLEDVNKGSCLDENLSETLNCCSLVVCRVLFDEGMYQEVCDLLDQCQLDSVLFSHIRANCYARAGLAEQAGPLFLEASVHLPVIVSPRPNTAHIIQTNELAPIGMGSLEGNSTLLTSIQEALQAIHPDVLERWGPIPWFGSRTEYTLGAISLISSASLPPSPTPIRSHPLKESEAIVSLARELGHTLNEKNQALIAGQLATSATQITTTSNNWLGALAETQAILAQCAPNLVSEAPQAVSAISEIWKTVCPHALNIDLFGDVVASYEVCDDKAFVARLICQTLCARPATLAHLSAVDDIIGTPLAANIEKELTELQNNDTSDLLGKGGRICHVLGTFLISQTSYRKAAEVLCKYADRLAMLAQSNHDAAPMALKLRCHALGVASTALGRVTPAYQAFVARPTTAAESGERVTGRKALQTECARVYLASNLKTTGFDRWEDHVTALIKQGSYDSAITCSEYCGSSMMDVVGAATRHCIALIARGAPQAKPALAQLHHVITATKHVSLQLAPTALAVWIATSNYVQVPVWLIDECVLGHPDTCVIKGLDPHAVLNPQSVLNACVPAASAATYQELVEEVCLIKGTSHHVAVRFADPETARVFCQEFNQRSVNELMVQSSLLAQSALQQIFPKRVKVEIVPEDASGTFCQVVNLVFQLVSANGGSSRDWLSHVFWIAMRTWRAVLEQSKRAGNQSFMPYQTVDKLLFSLECSQGTIPEASKWIQTISKDLEAPRLPPIDVQSFSRPWGETALAAVSELVVPEAQ